MKNAIHFIDLISISLLLWCQPAMATGCSNYPPNQPDSTFPSINGRMMYDTFISSGDIRNQIWMVDFATRKETQISQSSWHITDPQNPVFTLDGKWLLFTGIQSNARNLFVFKIGSSTTPINLTGSTGATKNEDVKVSFDGTQIVFKQTSWPGGIANFAIKLAPLVWTNGVPKLGIAQTLVGPTITQVSMPYLSPDASTLYYTTGDDKTLHVWSFSINPVGKPFLIDGVIGNPAYYPVVRNDYVTLYTKWISNQSYQILLRASGSTTSTVAPFNDCKSENDDAAPVNGTNYVIFSSTTAGGLQLYLGDAITGKRWPLSRFLTADNMGAGKVGATYR